MHIHKRSQLQSRKGVEKAGSVMQGSKQLLAAASPIQADTSVWAARVRVTATRV
jgi:hypothetical protein